jgi:hypothetical protein
MTFFVHKKVEICVDHDSSKAWTGPSHVVMDEMMRRQVFGWECRVMPLALSPQLLVAQYGDLPDPLGSNQS